MPSRLRWFVKKRGKRRTSARWQGMLGEALFDAGLFLLGAIGLYWLLSRYLLAAGASHGWWAWLAIAVPLPFLIYGGVGLGALLWQSVTSTERRAVVAQRATDWELPGAPERADRPALPTVPSIGGVIDSPGITLPYRLPIDAASGWISAMMAAVCIAWNTLVAVFVVQVVRSHLAGQPNWLLTWLMLPLVSAGIWTLVALARQILLTIVIGTTQLEVSHHPFRPGLEYEAVISQTGRLNVRWLQVQLVCDEQAIYQQGTDTRRAVARVYRETLFSQRKFDISPAQVFEQRLRFHVPPTAMHSFASTHNAVAWSLVVRGRVVWWGDIERSFPVYVYPPDSAAMRLAE
jgi:hypothetical protein